MNCHYSVAIFCQARNFNFEELIARRTTARSLSEDRQQVIFSKASTTNKLTQKADAKFKIIQNQTKNLEKEITATENQINESGDPTSASKCTVKKK